MPAGLDYFPSSNDRIMSDMFKEVAFAGSVEEAGTDAHTHNCMHNFKASFDSITLYNRAGFNNVSVYNEMRKEA